MRTGDRRDERPEEAPDQDAPNGRPDQLPVLSVIVPAYNAEHCLTRCLSSLILPE